MDEENRGTIRPKPIPLVHHVATRRLPESAKRSGLASARDGKRTTSADGSESCRFDAHDLDSSSSDLRSAESFGRRRRRSARATRLVHRSSEWNQHDGRFANSAWCPEREEPMMWSGFWGAMDRSQWLRYLDEHLGFVTIALIKAELIPIERRFLVRGAP